MPRPFASSHARSVPLRPLGPVGPLALLARTGLTLLALLGTAPAALADHTTSAFGGGSAGPINTMTADTLPSGLWGLNFQIEQLDLDSFSNDQLTSLAEADVDTHSVDRMLITSFSLDYGISDDFTLSARLPFIGRHDVREPEEDGGIPGIAAIGDSDGLGDVSLYGKYRFTDEHDREAVQFAVLAGVKLDTGETNEKDNAGELFETEFQPGTGSTDPLLGAAVTKRWGASTLSASILCAFTNDGSQDTELGDSTSYNLGYAYRLGGLAAPSDPNATVPRPRHRSEGTDWDLVLELNSVRRQSQKIDGERDVNSGGTRVFLSPGVRALIDRRWSAYATVGVPILEHLSGEEQQTDLRAVVGVSWTF